MLTLRYVVVDVFTDTALAGNQLAVFTDARGIDADLMQALTREMNFSETTFLLPAEQGGTARVRIFNPSGEMRFAGHPVLGSAWVLAQPLQRGVIELETGMGIVPVELDRDEAGGIAFGRMTQPLPTIEPYPDADALLAALGVGESLLPIERYDNGVPHTFVTLESAEAVASLGRTCRPSPHSRSRRTASPDRVRRGRRGCSRRRLASSKIRQRARQPDHSHVTSVATDSPSGASGSRSRRAPRSVGRRPSSRAPTVGTAVSSGSSAAVAPWSSRVASSDCEQRGGVVSQSPDLLDEYGERFRSLRRRVEEALLPLATSIDGRHFTCQLSPHGLDVRTGGYVVIEDGGTSRIGQILDLALVEVDGPELGSGGRQ